MSTAERFRGELLNRTEADRLRPGAVIVVDDGVYTVEAVTPDPHRPVVHVHTVTPLGGRVVFERSPGELVDVTKWVTTWPEGDA